MKTWIAFLRAINVGGHTVKMDRLKKLFEEIGFSNVATFIASGNVIFESKSAKSDALEAKIEKHLKSQLGYEVATFIRSSDELAEIADHNAFPDQEDGTLYVGFFKKTPNKAGQSKIMNMSSEADDFHFRGRELYWRCRVRSIDSEFSGAVCEKLLGMPATLRNMNTVRKIATKYSK